jgi:superfamily II DNA or RNA helicase
VDRTTTETRVRKKDAAHGGVMVSLPCGFGKTVWGVHTVVRRNRKALVLVHKAVLRDQWKESFERFCPGVRVGFVQGPTWQVDGYDVVIAMVMTLAKRDLNPSVMDSFGTVVVDEAHHMAAPVMNRAMRLFRARWVVGLSATKDRPDGLTPLLHWSLGPEGFRTERDGEGVRVSVALFAGGTPEILSRANGKPIVSLMINKLAANPRRNAFLADRIATMRKAGRVLMVLSDRVAQLDVLRDLLLRRGIPEEEIGIFKGGMKDAARVVQLARPVVLCSYGMANEGVDKKEADTCVMATPQGRVTQCIGRVQRPCETKQPPLVLDVADDDVAIFQALRWKRQTSYSKEKYEVQVLTHDAGEGRWFT